MPSSLNLLETHHLKTSYYPGTKIQDFGGSGQCKHRCWSFRLLLVKTLPLRWFRMFLSVYYCYQRKHILWWRSKVSERICSGQSPANDPLQICIHPSLSPATIWESNMSQSFVNTLLAKNIPSGKNLEETVTPVIQTVPFKLLESQAGGGERKRNGGKSSGEKTYLGKNVWINCLIPIANNSILHIHFFWPLNQ